MLLGSKAWVAEKLSLNQFYFESLKKMPKANILWIGSSDNLISIREVTNTEPGEIMVHRNIASQVRCDDISLMATLEHAIKVADVQYIIVCGYSNCSGIREVIEGNDDKPFLRTWLEDLYDIYNEHVKKIVGLSKIQEEKLLCELSIKEQIIKLSGMDIVHDAWKEKSSPELLGWYLDETSGTIKEIFSMTAKQNLTQVASVV